MNDFLTDERRRSLETIAPPAWADAESMAVTAVRRVRRRRAVARGVGGAVAGLALVAGAVLTLPDDDHSAGPAHSATASPSSPTAQSPGPSPTPSTTLPPTAVPEGWEVHEYGGLAFALPLGWTRTELPLDVRRPAEAWSGPGPVSFSVSVDEEPFPGAQQAPDSRESWQVPGAHEAEMLSYSTFGIHRAQVTLQQVGGPYYHLGLRAGSADELSSLLNGLRHTLRVTLGGGDVRSALGDTSALAKIDVSPGVPAGWQVTSLDGLSFAVPPGWEPTPINVAPDESGPAARWMAGDERELIVARTADRGEVLTAPRDSDRLVPGTRYRTFDLAGADFVVVVTTGPADAEEARQASAGKVFVSTSVVIRRADGAATYRLNLWVPQEEVEQSLRQVLGTLEVTGTPR